MYIVQQELRHTIERQQQLDPCNSAITGCEHYVDGGGGGGGLCDEERGGIIQVFLDDRPSDHHAAAERSNTGDDTGFDYCGAMDLCTTCLYGLLSIHYRYTGGERQNLHFT